MSSIGRQVGIMTLVLLAAAGCASDRHEAAKDREVSENPLAVMKAESFETLTTSQDSRHAAFIVKDGSRQSVMWDGKAGKKYDEVASIIFSADGRRLMYGARNGQKWFVVVDGKESPRYDGVAALSFSPDGKQVIYAPRQGGKQFMLVNGQAGPKFDSVTFMTFSSNGQHMAYSGKSGEKWVVVVDGQPSPATASCPSASPPAATPIACMLPPPWEFERSSHSSAFERRQQSADNPLPCGLLSTLYFQSPIKYFALRVFRDLVPQQRHLVEILLLRAPRVLAVCFHLALAQLLQDLHRLAGLNQHRQPALKLFLQPLLDFTAAADAPLQHLQIVAVGLFQRHIEMVARPFFRLRGRLAHRFLQVFQPPALLVQPPLLVKIFLLLPLLRLLPNLEHGLQVEIESTHVESPIPVGAYALRPYDEALGGCRKIRSISAHICSGLTLSSVFCLRKRLRSSMISKARSILGLLPRA